MDLELREFTELERFQLPDCPVIEFETQMFHPGAHF